MKAISLFSGVGGLDIGFERAGIETVLQAEQDPWCLEVLARHWPQTERVTDVRDVLRDTVRAERAGGTERDSIGAESGGGDDREGGRGADGIDLIYGGFPCQDVSVAGKRAGLGGERSGLWFEFERILSELRPRWAVIENVPGLLSSNKGRDFAVILDGLEDLGYSVGWAVLDAQHFGVPQRRRRVFIVAGATRRSVEQVLSLCEGCGGNPETGGTTGERLADPLTVGANQYSGFSGEPVEVAGTLGGGTGERGRSPDTDRMTFIASAISASAGHHGHSSPRGDGSDNLIAPQIVGALTAKGLGAMGAPEVDGGHYLPIPQIVGALSDGAHHGGVTNGQDAYTGRVFPAGGGVRRLTPLECERLMGWPDDWTRWTAGGKEIADSHRYRMAGNGVVASVAEWLGHRIVSVDADLGQVSIPIKTPWYLTDEALAAAIAQEVAWAKEKRA